jgi:hypothetical protein
MMLLMQILVALGVGLVIYALFGVFTSGKTPPAAKLKIQNSPPEVPDPGKEQKMQRLQSQIVQLEGELAESKTASSQEKSDLAVLKEKEVGFNTELKRREEWVAKAEAELAKIKTENVELTNKFTAKEKELEEEFTKNVNLTREVREIKVALEAKEMACRLKEDQLQAQKQKIEAQIKTISEHTATIAEYSRKEKISEWVPKSEFNQLNAEYTKLEKEFEANQERLKSFAAEIVHLRPAQDNKKALPAEEVKSPPEVPKETKLPSTALESVQPQEFQAQVIPAAEETPVLPVVVPPEQKELPQDAQQPKQVNKETLGDAESPSAAKDKDRAEDSTDKDAPPQ